MMQLHFLTEKLLLKYLTNFTRIAYMAFREPESYVPQYASFETTTPFTIFGHTSIIKIYDLINITTEQPSKRPNT